MLINIKHIYMYISVYIQNYDNVTMYNCMYFTTLLHVMYYIITCNVLYYYM